MDHDKALEDMRDAIAELRQQLNNFGSEDESVGHAVIDAWESLDSWMSKGGYRPEDWKP